MATSNTVLDNDLNNSNPIDAHDLNGHLRSMDVPETGRSLFMGHPVGLFVLFFTEMWERFSYYGMRAILMLYMVSEITKGGLGWTRAESAGIYTWYTSLVYLTPLLGGIIADRILGSRWAVVIGALLMTLGHGVLAVEATWAFYLGLGLLIIGNGFFKPNMTTVLGQMYPNGSPLKDSAYTIFYMGINSGAFLGTLLCGYLGEKWGWHYGFGAAGIFMLFGMLQFWFGQAMFGKIGLAPATKTAAQKQEEEDKKEALSKIEVDRLSVIGILAFFTVFFWLAFEQAGSSMNIFAEAYTDRKIYSAEGIQIYQWFSAIFIIGPMLVLTWVLGSLASKIVKQFPLTILFTGLSFAILWYLMGKIIVEQFTATTAEVPASWFQSINAFLIICLGPVFSKMWEGFENRNIYISGPVKFAVAMLLLGLGFYMLVLGSQGIPAGAKTAGVSMAWLTLAYLFHTLGELCLSPVGLSYVSKLSPPRLLGLMFGVWLTASFVAQFLGGYLAVFMDKIAETSAMSGFFMIFVGTSAVAALILFLLNKFLIKKMHGIK